MEVALEVSSNTANIATNRVAIEIVLSFNTIIMNKVIIATAKLIKLMKIDMIFRSESCPLFIIM